MKMRDLRPLALVVIILVAINAAILPLAMVSDILFASSYDPSWPVTAIVAAIARCSWLAMVVAFGIWIFRAGRNLVAAGFEDLQFSPASRIWWFAVPIASFFKPYDGMRELWNASHGNRAYADNTGLLILWWTLWLVSGTIALVVGFGMARGFVTANGAWIMSAANIASATTGILIVRGISEAQARLPGASLADVFT